LLVDNRAANSNPSKCADRQRASQTRVEIFEGIKPVARLLELLFPLASMGTTDFGHLAADQWLRPTDAKTGVGSYPENLMPSRSCPLPPIADIALRRRLR